MNKTEMIEAVASETGLAKTEVAKVLNAYTAEIIKAVAAGGDYTVIGFGKFYASQRQARTGRNPSTGAEIKIPAAMVPKFTAGKAFKDAVNAPKRPGSQSSCKSEEIALFSSEQQKAWRGCQAFRMSGSLVFLEIRTNINRLV